MSGTITDVRLRMIVPPPALALPQVFSASLLLNLQADALTLNDGDPIGTWADASGNGHDFTATGTARPTYHTDANGGYVLPDGIDDAMTGGEFADSLDTLVIFSIVNYEGHWPSVPGNNQPVRPLITKVTVDDINFYYDGWITQYAGTLFAQQAVYSDYDVAIAQDLLATITNDYFVFTQEYLGGFVMNNYQNNDVLNLYSPSSHGPNPLPSYTTTEPVRLFFEGGTGAPSDGYGALPVKAIMLYHVTDLVNWPTDRAAIISWLAAKYGITLP